MSIPVMAQAPPCPVREDGRLELGSYRGSFRDIDYTRTASSLVRTVREKRWLWYCLVRDPWVVAFAVVRTGYAANTFAFVQRIGERSFIADESRIGTTSRGWVQRQAGATMARFGPAHDPALRLDSVGSSWSIAGRFGAIDIDAECTHTAAPLAVVARVPGGVVNATEKGIGECVRGVLRVHGHPEVDLAGALAGYDLTHGLLGRRTAWRWAFGLGRDSVGQPLGFNLVSGFVGSAECASFGPAGPSLLDEPTFQFDASSYQKDWRIHGKNVDLVAEVGGCHTERKRLLLVRSDFLQAAAIFRGSVGQLAEGRLLGVVEDQDVTW